MSTIYYVSMKLDIVDEQKLVQLTKDFIGDKQGKQIDFCLKTHGIEQLSSVDKADTILKAIFTEDLHYDESFGEYLAAFDASYSWITVMTDWFDYVKDTLGQDTILSISSCDIDGNCVGKIKMTEYNDCGVVKFRKKTEFEWG